MLTDPLPVFCLSVPSDLSYVVPSLATVALTDLAPGRTVRIASGLFGTSKETLTISHSESAENKGIVTDRIAIRFESRRANPPGADVVAQATLTVSSPRAAFSDLEVLTIVRYLIGTVCLKTDTRDSLDFVTLARILAGEP